MASFVRQRNINPLDHDKLLVEGITKQKITSLIKTALLRMEALYTKAPEMTVNALVFADFLPNVLYAAPFCLCNITANIVGQG